MSLMDDFKFPCVLMEKVRTPDPEGSFVTTWVEGAAFVPAIVFSTSMEARTAEKIGVTSLYTVSVFEKGLLLEYHDVFKRQYDGKIFRVTSDGGDKQTPAAATFQFYQVTAEEWQLAEGGGA